MCLIKGIIKCILGLVNGMILTLGIIGMAVGGLLLWGMNALMPHMNSVMAQLKKFLSTIGVKDADETLSAVVQTIQSNSATIGTIIFVAGVFLTAVAVLGYIVLCCVGLKCVLYTLVGLISVLTVTLIIVGIVYGSNNQAKLFGQIESGLFKLVEGYKGYNFTNPESLIVNVLQSRMHCCGIYNSTDYLKARNWVKQIPDQTYPVTCCPSKGLKIEDASQCIKKRNSPYQNFGCYSKIKPELQKYIGYIFAFLGVVIAVLVVLDALFIVMIVCANKVDK